MPRCTAIPRAAALWAALLPSCTYLSGDRTVLVTSTPAGAAILVDGAATGQTTPAVLELDGILGDDHRITLQKPGYTDEHRDVLHYSTGYTSRWIDGAADIELPPVPLFWTLGDLFTPFARDWRYVPHELHVRLYPPGEGPASAPPEPR